MNEKNPTAADRTSLEQALWEWATDFYSADYSPAGEKLRELRDLILSALKETT